MSNFSMMLQPCMAMMLRIKMFMSLFKGKALDILHQLSSTATTYEDMKAAQPLLQAYGIAAAEVRQKKS